MKKAFITKRFGPDRLALIATINGILAEYAAQGYDLSLRQVYYQLVARGVVPNDLQSYKRVGDVVSDGRLAGQIEWDMIKDRGREFIMPPHWSSPKDILAAAAMSFRTDKWLNQPYRVEVMVEKQALEGVLIPTCTDLDVGFSANKGYSSSSALYEAGQRIARHLRRRLQVVVLYLGDHDPSGIDMTRDVAERLAMFAEATSWRGTLAVKRIALNRDQVDALQPPENPAKESDSRYAGYVAEHGAACWELDAIEPSALARLVEDAVLGYRDEGLWDEAVAREAAMRATVARLAEEYQED